MNLVKTNILRVQAVVLAVFVSVLSMGITFHWQACLYSQEFLGCEVMKQGAACCSTSSEEPICSCSSQSTCSLSFSKYIQFDFEVLTSEVKDLESVLNFCAFRNATLFSTEPLHLLQHGIVEYSLPPPKSGRDILCFIQMYLI